MDNTQKTRFYVALIALFFTSHFTFAQECIDESVCVDQGQWQIGVALGAGVRTNPLVDGKNIPLVVQLDLAWYGENAYFDNGELGFTWLSKSRFDVDTYLSLDRERTSFSALDPANIFVPDSTPSEPSIPIEPDNGGDGDLNTDLTESSRDIARRKWAILFGNQIRYFGENYRLSLALETDISGVHKGQRASLQYQHFWSGEKWRFSVMPSLNYQSDKLTDYYYGLSERDQVTPEQLYKASGGIQPQLTIQYTYQLSARWHFISNASYLKLHTGLRNSPIVNDNNITNIFIGAGYRF